MNIGNILGIILFAISALCIAFAIKSMVGKYKNKGRGLTLAVIGGVAALFFVIVPFSLHTVDTGEVAVVKHLGEARTVRTAGTYFDFWLTNTYDLYDSKVQNQDISTQAYSKDAQTMDIIMTVQYQIDSSKAVEIAKKYGSLETLGNRIQSVSIEKAKSVLSSYSAMTIIETRATISPEVEMTIKNAIDENYYVNIVAVVLTNIDFSDAFELTVENKMIAEQEKLKAEYEKETAIVNAEKELEVAKLEAQAKIAQAEADAKSQVLAAEAEAEAIKLKSIEVARALGFTISETATTDKDGNAAIEYAIDFTGKSADEIKLITDYIKYIEYLSKWDGKLPTVYTSEGGASIIIPQP